MDSELWELEGKIDSELWELEGKIDSELWELRGEITPLRSSDAKLVAENEALRGRVGAVEAENVETAQLDSRAEDRGGGANRTIRGVGADGSSRRPHETPGHHDPTRRPAASRHATRQPRLQPRGSQPAAAGAAGRRRRPAAGCHAGAPHQPAPPAAEPPVQPSNEIRGPRSRMRPRPTARTRPPVRGAPTPCYRQHRPVPMPRWFRWPHRSSLKKAVGAWASAWAGR